MIKKLYTFFMEIYIETFLLQNILINLCLLRLVEITTKTRTTFIKLLLASVVGSAFSVFIVGHISNQLILNITKFLCALSMIILAFKQSKKQFIFNFILLFLYTFAINGAITSLSSCTYYTNFGYITTSKLNLDAICLIIIALTYIVQLVAKQLKLKFCSNNFIYKITITKNKKSISLNAYLDSGNLLNLNGNPVVVIDLNTYLSLTNTNLIEFISTKSKTIQTNTVTGQNNLKVFEIDEIKIKFNHKKYCLTNQYVAVNTNNCFKNTSYKALLNPLMF